MTSSNTPSDTKHSPVEGGTSTAKPRRSKRKLAVIGGVAAALIVGVMIGKAGGSTATAATPTPGPAPVTITEKADAPAPITVTAPVPAQATVTVTEKAEAPAAAPAAPAPAAAKGPGDPHKNGKFLLGSQIDSGTWQCDESETIGSGSNQIDMAYWEVTSETNDIVNNGNDTIAVVGDEGHTVTLKGCKTNWVKV
jgi:hypothetical protein